MHLLGLRNNLFRITVDIVRDNLPTIACAWWELVDGQGEFRLLLMRPLADAFGRFLLFLGFQLCLPLF